MLSKLRRGIALRLIPLYMLLAYALSACATTSTILYAPDCFTKMTQTKELRNPTPHAPLPAEPTAGAWVNYGNEEAGQTDKANDRASTILHIGDTCDSWQVKAKSQVEHKSLWSRIFG